MASQRRQMREERFRLAAERELKKQVLWTQNLRISIHNSSLSSQVFLDALIFTSRILKRGLFNFPIDIYVWCCIDYVISQTHFKDETFIALSASLVFGVIGIHLYMAHLVGIFNFFGGLGMMLWFLATLGILVLEKENIAVHEDSAHKTKSSDAMDELPTFNVENMQSNTNVINYSRTFMLIIGAVIARILGINGLLLLIAKGFYVGDFHQVNMSKGGELAAWKGKKANFFCRM